MKKTSIEPLLLFIVFFLPGYLAQNSPVDQAMFDNLFFNLVYSVTSIGQILLLLYILSLREKRERLEEVYGLKRFRIIDAVKALPISFGIGICILPFIVLPSLLSDEVAEVFTNPVAWKISSPAMIVPIFITCITTGYREELFFRSYLFTYLKGKDIPTPIVIAVCTLLFSLGHMYQGVIGFAGTAAIGLFLALVFLKGKNVHTIAVAHGIYNFVTLMFSLR